MSKDSTIGRPRKGRRQATHPYIAENPDFPLSYHKASRQFYKTHKGRRYYFGGAPVEARQRFDEEWSFIVRGLAIPESVGLTVEGLINLWLDDRLTDANAGLIETKTWDRYKRWGAFCADQLGRKAAASAITTNDFKELHRAITAKTKDSPSVGRVAVNIAKMPWKWGLDNGKVDKVAMGSRFKGPPKSELRVKRFDRGRQTYEAAEIHKMLGSAQPYMRAAILLGINGGYTQAEIATLESDWLDLKSGVIDHLRGKTKFARRVTLWPETIKALQKMPYHPRQADARGFLFATRNGRPYADDGANGIAQAFTRLMVKHGVELEQSGFGKLRATHRTVADGANDANASKLIMGHALGQGVEEHYIRSIDDNRLQAVTDHVRAWLFDGKSSTHANP